MRASRLVRLLSLLQAGGLVTTAQLAADLEVSQRTVLRDIEALSSAGFPVYGVRGRMGGFRLIEGFSGEIELPARPPSHGGLPRTRARVRLSPRGRRLAVLLGQPEIRPRRSVSPEPGPQGWTEAWIPVESAEATVLDLLALGPDAELISPPDLRDQVRAAALAIAMLHGHAAGPAGLTGPAGPAGAAGPGGPGGARSEGPG